jgi:hypothetical protein
MCNNSHIIMKEQRFKYCKAHIKYAQENTFNVVAFQQLINTFHYVLGLSTKSSC